jgi:hypothetical protein
MTQFVFVATLILSGHMAVAATPKVVRLEPHAGSCSTARITGCNTETHGALESGDCQLSDGTRVDYFSFSGQAGQLIEITLRPLDPSFKQPQLALFSPLGDRAEPPIIGGGNTNAALNVATIWYELSSSGTWEIAVTSDDLFASGAYVLHVYCYPNEPGPQSCVAQYLLCGQTGAWSLNADSCRFESVNSAYAVWWIYGVQNDVLQFVQESFSFTPLFGIYDENDRLMQSSINDGSFRANLNFRVPATGWYYVTTSSEQENRGGDFTVTLNCQGSGCSFPYLLQDIPSRITVPKGTAATIPFTINALGGFTTRLFDRDTNVVAALQTPASSITTPPIHESNSYTLVFENACGSWESSPFVVAPEGSRRRAVRK